jgi:hypothetical protein
MADFYPVLIRAVARLTNSNAQIREELYGHARAIVEAELRQQVPPKSEPEIARELAALETAIRRVEVELPLKAVLETGDTTKPPASAAAELDEVLKSVGAMLLGMACIVAVLAFTGVIFVRGLVWVYAKVIGYPTLLAATTAVLCLFVLLSWALLRKIRIEEVIRLLRRRAHGAPKKARGLAGSGQAQAPLRQ